MNTAPATPRHLRARGPATTTLTLPALPARAQRLEATSPRLVDMVARVRAVHGAPAHGVPGPWALVGFRIGADALLRLGLDRDGARELHVTHRAPRTARYACMLDGLQASTGASLGKLNLELEPVAGEAGLETVIHHRAGGRTLRYRPLETFRERFHGVAPADYPAAARRLDMLPDQELFSVVEWGLLRLEVDPSR